MTKKKTGTGIHLLDVVTLTQDVTEHHLSRGEIGAVVECYPGDAYEAEFVAQDGYTYALVTLTWAQLVPLRQKRAHSDVTLQPATL